MGTGLFFFTKGVGAGQGAGMGMGRVTFWSLSLHILAEYTRLMNIRFSVADGVLK